MKAAFLTTRFEKPSYRFRIAQFIPYLEENGISCHPLTIKSFFISRWMQFLKLSPYDLVVVQKKMFGLIDRLILRSRARRLVYDVDDAIMYRRDGRFPSPPRARRFRAMVRMSDMVLAGNEFLCLLSANYSRQVVCFRTVVDTDYYVPRAWKPKRPTAIGWAGSASTNRYLMLIMPVLARLAREHDIVLRIISDTLDGIEHSAYPELKVEFVRWDSASERENIQAFDIGVMPLPDNEWVKGKCALKCLLYMASGVPAVCSPVGVVTRLITEGSDGFFARTEDEWHDKLERLILDEDLAIAMAARERERVVENYSVSVAAPRLLNILRSVIRRSEREHD